MKHIILILSFGLFFTTALIAQPMGSYGIKGEQAPSFEVAKWIDGNGKSTEIELSDYKGKVVYILNFQSWCPGCHSLGFPMLKYLKKKYERNDDVIFLSIQTVFEGQKINDFSKLRKTQKKYKLAIPFGHDDGSNTGNKYSNVLDNYKTGGTPWHIIIDRTGKVVFNDFEIEASDAVRIIKKALNE